MKYLKHMWQFAPRIVRSLLIAILVIFVAGVSTTALGAAPKVPQPQSILKQSDSGLSTRRRTSPGIYTVPSSCSVPIIPSIVTEEEIKLRQYQVDFVKYIEQQAKLDQEATLTSTQDVLAVEKFRLDCEIMLLRAQQILQADDTEPLPELPITNQEVELRKRQFEIAKQIDEDELIAQQAGLASLNNVWKARQERTDAEILLLQATTQQKMQDKKTAVTAQ